MKTISDIFLECEGITKMTFPHFKHALLRLIHFFFFQKNLLVIIESLLTIYPYNLKCHLKMGFIS
jgi:hypothetical protein